MSNLDKRLSDLERRAPRSEALTIVRVLVRPVHRDGVHIHNEEVGQISAGVYTEHPEPIRLDHTAPRVEKAGA